MRSYALGKGERRILLQDVMDNSFCAARNPPAHTMQPLIYKGIYHLHNYDGFVSSSYISHAGMVLSAVQRYQGITGLQEEGILAFFAGESIPRQALQALGSRDYIERLSPHASIRKYGWKQHDRPADAD